MRIQFSDKERLELLKKLSADGKHFKYHCNSGSQEGTVLSKKHLTVSGNVLGCHNLVGEGEMSLASGG